MKLTINLTQDRAFNGLFTLCDTDGVLLASGRARGKADNGRAIKEGNPSRDSTLPFGDTPTGCYAPTRIRKTRPGSRMGEYWFHIEGISGDALKARENGRVGLGVHAGREDTKGWIAATHGCTRLGDTDFKDVHRIVGDSLVSIEVIET